MRCRREALLDLLEYEGEKDSPGEICCDVCDATSSRNLREEAALEGFFSRNSRSYTAVEAAKLLTGTRSISWSEEQAVEAINYLINGKKLIKSRNPLWKNKLIWV